MQEIEDAQKIRRTVIDCFERASLPSISEQERKKILHFVIVGGGPTGVEFAAELHDFVNEDIARLYPTLKQHVTITLLEAGDHILSMYFTLPLSLSPLFYGNLFIKYLFSPAGLTKGLPRLLKINSGGMVLT